MEHAHGIVGVGRVEVEGRPTSRDNGAGQVRPRTRRQIGRALDHVAKIGTIGDLACFSFYATKNMTTGEGRSQ